MTLAEKYANEYTGYEHNHSWTIVQHGFNAGYDHGKEERTKLVTQLDICRESLASAVKENEKLNKFRQDDQKLINSLQRQLDECQTMLGDSVRQFEEKSTELQMAEDLIYNQNNEIIDKALQIKELVDAVRDFVNVDVSNRRLKEIELMIMSKHGAK